MGFFDDGDNENENGNDEGLPPHNGTDTSIAAAESIAGRVATDEKRVLAFIEGNGKFGATDDEIEVCLDLIHQTASARRNGLMRASQVVDSGRRRRTRSNRSAKVWVTRENHVQETPDQ